ncbi:hypothetical protein D3C81_1527370 [compost metagenome]
MDLLACQRHFGGGGNRAEPVERTAGGIEHAAQQAVAHRQALRAGFARGRHAGRLRRRFERIDTGARHQAGHVRLRHQVEAVGAKADHFGLGRARAAMGVLRTRQFDQAVAAHRHAQAHGFQHQPGGARQAATGALAIDLGNTGRGAGQRVAPARGVQRGGGRCRRGHRLGRRGGLGVMHAGAPTGRCGPGP